MYDSMAQPSAVAEVSTATGAEHGDLQVVTALQTEVATAIQAEIDSLTAGIEVEEWDPATLPESLRASFDGYYLEHRDGWRMLVFPAGQDPAQRLAVTRTLLNRAAVTA